MPPAAPLTSSRCPARSPAASRTARRREAGERHRGRLLERQGRRLRRPRVRRPDECVLGERTRAEGQYVVADRDPVDVSADGLDRSRGVEAGHPGSRPAHADTAHQPGDVRVAAQHVPVVRVQPGRPYPHQHVAGADLGISMSASRSTSGGPNRSCTMAFTTRA